MRGSGPLWTRLTGHEETLVVLLHGLTGASESVMRYGPQLPGVACLLIDLPWHGRSPDVGDFSCEDVTARVAEEVDRHARGFTRVHVLGLSLGATVSRGLPATTATRIDSLVLIRPTHTAEPFPEHLSPNLFVAKLLEDDPLSAAERLRTHPDFIRIGAASPAAAANLLAKSDVPDAESARRRAFVLRAGSGWVCPPAPAATPALVVASADDALHPESVAHRWVAELPRARLERAPAPSEPTHSAHVRVLVEEHLGTWIS